MKKLILMRGCSGSGKTTVIKSLGLENNTLNPDTIRIMMSGYEIFEKGIRISKKDSYKVFKELYSMLEQRMEYGLLTIIDHPNLSEMNIDKYKSMCFRYGYECIVCNVDVPLEVLKERNAKRTDKIVSNEELEAEYKEFKENKIPSFCKVIKPSQIEAELVLKYQDLSKYKKIVHIGDIHGCATVLKQALGDISFDTFYIFCGDYIDRGIENIEVLKFLISIKRKPNVVLLKGNHELNLLKYINGEEIYGKSFQDTRKELEGSDISLKDLKDFTKCLKNFYAYRFNDKKVVCTHGGISSLSNFSKVSEYGFIIGSGNMETTNIDEEWNTNEPKVYQVHGHRNPYNVNINEYSNSFNLEGAVEEGGYLRTIELSGKTFSGRTYKNDIFKKRKDIDDE